MLCSFAIDARIPKYERSQNVNLVEAGAFFLAGPFGPALADAVTIFAGRRGKPMS